MVARLVPDDRRSDVILLAPTALLPLAVLAVLAPLVAGGGNELFPDSQLTAYPVSGRTRYAASLVLTPLNLAWSTQLIAVVALAAFIAESDGLVAMPVLTILAYVALTTVAGQALAWLVVGIRQRRGGRIATWATAGAFALAAAAILVTGNVGEVLDRSPTTPVVVGALNGSNGAWTSWSVTTGALLVLAVLAHLVGRRACVWALGRPGDAAARLDGAGRAPPGAQGRDPGRAAGGRPGERLALPVAAARAHRARHDARHRGSGRRPWTGPPSCCSPAWWRPAPDCCSA